MNELEIVAMVIDDLRKKINEQAKEIENWKALWESIAPVMRELLGPCQYVTGAWTDGKGHVNHQTCGRERPCLSHDIRAMVQPDIDYHRD